MHSIIIVAIIVIIITFIFSYSFSFFLSSFSYHLSLILNVSLLSFISNIVLSLSLSLSQFDSPLSFTLLCIWPKQDPTFLSFDLNGNNNESWVFLGLLLLSLDLNHDPNMDFLG